jgi:hypothetical protein
MPERPPKEPTFTETMQIGIVVPDLGVILEVFSGMPKKQTGEG